MAPWRRIEIDTTLFRRPEPAGLLLVKSLPCRRNFERDTSSNENIWLA